MNAEPIHTRSHGGAFQTRVKEFLTRTSKPVLEKPVLPDQLIATPPQRSPR